MLEVCESEGRGRWGWAAGAAPPHPGAQVPAGRVLRGANPGEGPAAAGGRYGAQGPCPCPPPSPPAARVLQHWPPPPPTPDPGLPRAGRVMPGARLHPPGESPCRCRRCSPPSGRSLSCSSPGLSRNQHHRTPSPATAPGTCRELGGSSRQAGPPSPPAPWRRARGLGATTGVSRGAGGS